VAQRHPHLHNAPHLRHVEKDHIVHAQHRDQMSAQLWRRYTPKLVVNVLDPKDDMISIRRRYKTTPAKIAALQKIDL
jgi:hypothetical protein